MMRSRRALLTAGTLFAAHEFLLHSPVNALLEQGGLFGQDRAQDILLRPHAERSNFISAVSTRIYDESGQPAVISLLEMLTSRHDPRVIKALLDRLRPINFRLLLRHIDNTLPGLTDGFRVVLNMVSVSDKNLQGRVIEMLIQTGITDDLAEEIFAKVFSRSRGQSISLRQWLLNEPSDAIQFIREREYTIRIWAMLLSNSDFRYRLQTNFDSCFVNPEPIRRLLGKDQFCGAALVSTLSTAAVGAIGKHHAAQARTAFLSSLSSDDPQFKFLTQSKKPVKDTAMLSFLTPIVAAGEQITIERMKLSGSLGVISGVVSMVIGRRRGGIVKNLFWTGLGSSLFVLWNDVFINWDRFFAREVFPCYDRSSEDGRMQDIIWSSVCSCIHYLGNLSLFAIFPGAFLPYFLISSAHFSGELNAFLRWVRPSSPPHSPPMWTPYSTS